MKGFLSVVRVGIFEEFFSLWLYCGSFFLGWLRLELVFLVCREVWRERCGWELGLCVVFVG